MILNIRFIFYKKISFIFFFFFVLFHCDAQNRFSIAGKVTDSKNKNIEVGNAIILSVKDSSLITGNVFMDGEYKVSGIKDSVFILKITALGYNDSLFVIKNDNKDTLLDLKNITLKDRFSLQTVEVVGRTPLFEDDGEKVKVNVENTALSSSGTVLDVLKQTPKVVVDNNDNVMVFGKGLALIYLDGQLISSTDILKSISSSELKNIEIISNPSAKYDAAGKAIINIVTKKNNLQGFNGNIIQNLIYGKYLLSYTGLRLQVRKKKWGLSASYGLNPGKLWSSDDYYRNYTENGRFTEMNNKIYTVTNQSNVNYYRFGANYFIDSSSSLNFQYDGFYSKIEEQTNNTNLITADNAFQYSLQTHTLGKPQMTNNSFNLNYSKKLDTLESEFNAAIQYSAFSSGTVELIDQTSRTDTTSAFQQKRNNANNNINLLTAQVSYDKSFNKFWKLETGVKNSYVYKTSLIHFDNYYGGDWVSDPAYFNGFNYNENILAGYTQGRYKKNKLNARVGLRGEYTSTNGFSKTLNSTIINRKYLDLFPSAFLGCDLTKDISSGITYSRRIVRPVYQDMDPFINYVDSLSSFRGNPYLKPEYTHSVEWSLTYLKQLSLTVGYARTDGSIKLTVDKLNNSTDAFVAMKTNLNKSETYSFALNLPYELPWWTTYNYFGYYISSFSYGTSSAFINNKKPNFYFYTYNEFRVKNIFSLEATFTYNSGGVDGIFISDKFYVLSANLKKKFFKDKLVVRFIANDILNSGKSVGKSNVQGYNLNYVSRVNSHYYMIALNYKFGRLKAQDVKDKSINTDEFERIKMGKKD